MTQSRREFTQPDHLPSESLPGCCFLETQIKCFFCFLGTLVLMQFFSCLPSAKLPHFPTLTLHANPGAFGLPGAVPPCAEREHSLLKPQPILSAPSPFLVWCLFFTQNPLGGGNNHFCPLSTRVVFFSKCVSLTSWRKNRL